MNQLAAEHIGLDPTKPITDQALNKAKQPFNAVYSQVGKTLGTVQADPQFKADVAQLGAQRGGLIPDQGVEQLKGQLAGLDTLDADQAINTVRGLRRDAGQNIRAPYDPERQAKGYAQQQAADAIDNLLERAATARGEPGLIDQLRSARQGLAKINTVQQALVGNDVSPKILAQMADRGAPLSGRLKLIADVATNFPHVMRDRTALVNKSGFTVPEYALTALEGPKGAGIVALRHGTQAILRSNLYQNALGPVARDLTGSRLGDYFPRAAPAETPAAPAAATGGLPFTETHAGAPGHLSPAQAVLASRLAGDLQLAPEAPGHGLPFEPSDVRLGDLQAATPPPVHGDIPFTASQPLGTALAGNLELARAPARGGITFTPAESNPRAAGMSETTERGTLFPELRAVRSGRDVGEGLALEQPPQAPAPPLALPAPTRGPIAVDQAGRAGATPADVAAHRQAFGLDELGPGVRQPAAGPNPEREAAAAQARGDGGPVQFAGNELGPTYQSAHDLKKQARAIAQKKFAGKTVVNAADGSQILIPPGGIKHGLSGFVSRPAALAMTKLDEVLAAGRPVGSEADKLGRPDIKAVHFYDTPISVGGQPATIRSVVRELRNGRRYYDHFELEAGPPPGGAAPSGAVGLSGKLGGPGTDSTTAAPAVPKSVPREASQVYAQRSEPVTPDRAGFLSRFQQLSQDSPTNPAGRLFSKNVSVELQPEPTDEHTVHVEDLRALTTGQGHGAAALKKLTGLADRHGVRLTLDAHPLDKGGISKEKLVQFYQRAGFTPAADEWRPNLMVREPKP